MPQSRAAQVSLLLLHAALLNTAGERQAGAAHRLRGALQRALTWAISQALWLLRLLLLLSCCSCQF